MGVKYTNNAATTLSSGINNSVTSVSVASSSTFPAITGSNYFYATFDDATNLEIVKVTAVSGTTWTIVRAQDDTSARAFSSGDTVELRINSAMLTDVVNDAMSDAFSRQAFTGDGSETDFTLSKAPATENDLIVFIEGVFQTQSAYSVSGTTLTFSAAPANSREIIVYHITAAVNGDSLSQNNFTGDGSDTTFTLGVDPLHENNTMVFLDGVYQHKATYSVSGTTLTFDAAPASGVLIECITHTQTEINTPSSNSVVTASIVDDNVTQAKLADDAVGADQLASSAVVTASIVDDNVTQAKIADDAVGADQLASSAVVTASVVNDAITTAKIADDQITLAKMAGLARGKIIYGDSSGNPAALTVGSNGQVLKSDGTDISWGTDATVAALTSEEVQDIAGAMFSSNTETGITATYQDGDGTIDLVIGTLNQDTTGTAATVTTAAQPAITSLGTLTTLTVDDMTLNGSTISDAGAFDIDAGGNIKLDAGGGQLQFYDDGTEIGVFESTGSNFIMESKVQDKDIKFVGNDGGSGITAMTIDMSEGGKVGIGPNASSPTQYLHIKDTSGSNDVAIQFTGDHEFTMGQDANDQGNFKIARSAALGTNDAFTVQRSNGNIGIGTNNPYAKLNVNGHIRAENSAFLAGREDAGNPAYAFHDDSNTGMFNIASDILCFATGGTERMRIAANGSLTLDSLSYDAAADSMTINNGLFLSSGYIRSGAADFSLGTASQGAVLTIDDTLADCVGIGTTTPASYNDYADNFVIESTGNTGMTIASGTSNYGSIRWADGTSDPADSMGIIDYNHSTNSMRFFTNNSDRMSIDSSGLFRVPTFYTNPTYATHRAVYVESEAGYECGYNASIRASKTNIESISDVSWIYDVDPITFNRRVFDKENKEYTDESFPDKEYGIIAEDLEELAPELCFYDYESIDGEIDTENKVVAGIHYDRIVAPLIKVIQELEARITELEDN